MPGTWDLSLRGAARDQITERSATDLATALAGSRVETIIPVIDISETGSFPSMFLP